MMLEAAETTDCRPLHVRLVEGPAPHDEDRARAMLGDLLAESEGQPWQPRLAALAADHRVATVLLGILGCSPYLTGLVRRDPARLVRLLDAAPEAYLAACLAALGPEMTAAASLADAMQLLRRLKADVALLLAVADLGGVWPVMRITEALSDTADATVAASIRYLFARAAARGDWRPSDTDAPEAGSGYIVLAMGKHGARELNYSSDIDLVVFFDPLRSRLRDGQEPQAFFVRMTRDLVKLMQERTGDGYVFRTDLRLRPDPGATQVAISVDAALNYYESFGQNWERAALIKARPIAGDLDAGRSLLRELAPFIWRKYLDFAAIADIHAMKRQIHAFKGFGTIGVAGHNIKVGRGGIREIEFFAQTQQLIAGGRQPDLRVPTTLGALDRLSRRGWIRPAVVDDLTEAYTYLRRIEHRLQMLADEQTQTLPTSVIDLERLARFSGYRTTEAFSTALVERLERVQGHYAALFEATPELTAAGANMVFAGEADDPGTIEALGRMGYERPSDVVAAVRGWHHGRYPAVRTPRARELLTEVQPLLIEALARTSDPDSALASFDRFLADLPSGVQLFSLLRLVADIMGTAPRLARILGRRRRVLDAVLDPGFFGTIPDSEALKRIVEAGIGEGTDLQEALDRARIIGSEQSFLIGVRVLSGTISAGQAGGAYAALAGHLIAGLVARVEAELQRAHGRVPGGGAAVIAMGKLGGREMTAASDLDLIVVYDFDADAVQSDGARPLAPSQYYARYTQRLISALSVPTAEGPLYEVDMRLRPSGQKGPVATQLSSFVEYQAGQAWTWEHLALTRARVVAGPPDLVAKVEAAIRHVLVQPRDRSRIAKDVHEMRELIAKQKGTTDLWDLKQVRGGLVDLEFIAQYLQLVHAAAQPAILDQSTVGALSKLAASGVLLPADADVLIPAATLINNLTQVLRLTLDGPFVPDKSPDGLKALLARVGEAPDFSRLEASLADATNDVARLFDTLVV
ncbi:MAG: bifunctional [glutamine synthetase] adenylyltransferase/[glutamine synthetase]-adenylyl-L-tyrosine phosphorylase [Hyphomicrobiaceae bacterium]|nr:bifunctional [glutamine synthetase] adenylyltransferase/[glutamine synthetase]-adenylyl-L-tyrosine phosphorylase [Hyphomicrobiaceae bacterium]